MWNNEGLINQGCAISFQGPSDAPSGTLEVDKCSFFHCHSSDVGSGGVFAHCISSASVSDSIFFDCSCSEASTQEGGGVFMGNLSGKPLVQSCSFISCTSGDDSGGCGIWYCSSSLTYSVDFCRFITCKAAHPESGQGGGAVLAWNEQFVPLKNCLFFSCDAVSEGGGLWIDCRYATNDRKFVFCFFSQNTADSGKDVCVWRFPLNYVPLLHCFTTSTGKTVGEYENTNEHNNWLPQGTLSFVVDCYRHSSAKHDNTN